MCDAVIDAAVLYAVKGSESVVSLVPGGAAISQVRVPPYRVLTTVY